MIISVQPIYILDTWMKHDGRLITVKYSKALVFDWNWWPANLRLEYDLFLHSVAFDPLTKYSSSIVDAI